MKKSLVVLTVLLFGSLFIVSCNQEIEPEVKNVEKAKVVEFEVVSVHDITLKSDVDEKEFEVFVMNEVAPIYNKMKGQKFTLAKGDRGIRTNKYAIILTFESVEDRDRIYPVDIGFSEEFNKEFEGKDSLWVKFDSMAEGFDGMHNTDYVKVAH